MASNFTNFLISFGEDPQQLEAFKQDPHAALDAAGLTPAEKTLLLSGNMQLIRSALLADPGLKEAMGIPTHQNLPLRLPQCVRIVELSTMPPPPPKAGSTGDSGSKDATKGNQDDSKGSKGA